MLLWFHHTYTEVKYYTGRYRILLTNSEEASQIIFKVRQSLKQAPRRLWPWCREGQTNARIVSTEVEKNNPSCMQISRMEKIKEAIEKNKLSIYRNLSLIMTTAKWPFCPSLQRCLHLSKVTFLFAYSPQGEKRMRNRVCIIIIKKFIINKASTTLITPIAVLVPTIDWLSKSH